MKIGIGVLVVGFLFVAHAGAQESGWPQGMGGCFGDLQRSAAAISFLFVDNYEGVEGPRCIIRKTLEKQVLRSCHIGVMCRISGHTRPCTPTVEGCVELIDIWRIAINRDR